MVDFASGVTGACELTRRSALALAGMVGVGLVGARAARAAMPQAPSRGTVAQGEAVGLPVVEFGAYPQTSEGEPLPIEWYVLAEEGGRRLLLSKYVLDCGAYNVAFTGVTWQTCDLRFWLNGAFARAAFNNEERARILYAELENAGNEPYGMPGSDATFDHVFCLSLDEVDRYVEAGHPALAALPTDYARSRLTNGSGFGGGVIWWLRSPGDSSDEAAYVYRDGTIDAFGDGVDYPYYGIRPAIWLCDEPQEPMDASAEDLLAPLQVDDGGVVLEAQLVDGGGSACELAYVMRATYRGALVRGALLALWARDDLGYYLEKHAVSIEVADGLEYAQEQSGAVALELAAGACALECQRVDGVFEPGLAALPLVEFGSYPQTAAGDVLPIAWRVIAEKDGAQLLLADQALDCVPYNAGRANVTWETCTLRAWLNGAFAEAAFTGEERDQIIWADVENPANADRNVSGGNPTSDLVFCLSLDELREYLSAGTSKQVGEEYTHLSAAATEFAAQNGAYVGSDAGYSPWWLRSPGDRASFASCVTPLGLVRSDGYSVDHPVNAVRPALWRRCF